MRRGRQQYIQLHHYSFTPFFEANDLLYMCFLSRSDTRHQPGNNIRHPNGLHLLFILPKLKRIREHPLASCPDYPAYSTPHSIPTLPLIPTTPTHPPRLPLPWVGTMPNRLYSSHPRWRMIRIIWKTCWDDCSNVLYHLLLPPPHPSAHHHPIYY